MPASRKKYGIRIAGLDEILCGGLLAECNYLVRGGRGSGKTTRGAHYMKEAAQRGKRSVIYSFDEHLHTFLLRYIELDSELRKTVGVLKKRTGDFGKTLCQIEITDQGFHVGEPLRGLRGSLSGVPETSGNTHGPDSVV